MVRHDDPEYVRRFGAAERSRAFGPVAAGRATRRRPPASRSAARVEEIGRAAAAADGLTDLPYRLFAARALVGIP